MSILKTNPAVFAVGNTYQIMVPVTCEALAWVKIGENCYYDHSNGIMRSRVSVHRITVPMEELNNAGEYAVCLQKVIERKPYFTETEEVIEQSFKFYSVSGEKIRAYHISDAHNLIEAPVKATKKFEELYGEIDFLILNGDIPDHSGDIANFDNIYELVSQITAGNKPVVFSRGNHDMRGIFAENIADYTPTENGNSYYTFKLGKIWGIILDCAEDKVDSHPEYGNTVCCSFFRRLQTKYLENIIESCDSQYNSDEIKYKLVVAHNPFTSRYAEPFNIEEELYTYWSKLLRENIKPDVMICGHKHELRIDMPNDECDNLGQPCPVVIGSTVSIKNKYFAGAGFVFENEKIMVVFNNSEKIIREEILNFR